MPFASAMVAPLGLGVVCGALRQQNISVKCHFLNIDLAERIPEAIYSYPANEGLNVDAMLSDWLFSEHLFGEDAERDSKFIALLNSEDSLGHIRWRKDCPSLADFLAEVPLLKREVKRCIERGAVQVLADNPKIVGCSSTFFQRLASLAMLKKIKELAPDVVTIIGGADCEGEAGVEAVKAFGFIDYLFSGDGDITVPQLVSQILNNQTPVLGYGVYNKDKALKGEIEVACVDGKDITKADLSDFYERIKNSRLNTHASKKYFLETSRGCWKGDKQHCSFCGLNGQRLCFRHKDCDAVLAELRHAYFDLGCRMFLTADTVLDMVAFRGLFEQFSKEAPDALFSYESVSTLTEPQIDVLADNGIMIIQSGIESLIAKHAKLLNKGNDPMTSIALLKFCQERRIQVIWNMLTSIPGDELADYDILKSLVPKICHFVGPSWGKIRFDKHSLYWQEPDKYGLKLQPMICYSILLPKGLVDLNRWAFFYDNLNPQATVDSEAIRDIGLMVKDWYNATHPQKYKLEFESDYVIYDSRPCAKVTRYTMSEDEFKVMELARKPILVAKVENISENIGIAVENLKSYGYLLEMDGKLLALPLKQPSDEKVKKYRDRYRTMINIIGIEENCKDSFKVIEEE